MLPFFWRKTERIGLVLRHSNSLIETRQFFSSSYIDLTVCIHYHTQLIGHVLEPPMHVVFGYLQIEGSL